MVHELCHAIDDRRFPFAARLRAAGTADAIVALYVSGPAGQPVVLVYGLPAANGVPLFGWGLLHLDLGLPIGVVANGLIPGTADLDAKGEFTALLPVPTGFGGLPLMFQAAVGVVPGTFVLTNAQGTVLTP